MKKMRELQCVCAHANDGRADPSGTTAALQEPIRRAGDLASMTRVLEAARPKGVQSHHQAGGML